MTNGEGLSEWLKWIAGGIIAGMALFWQWMERKVDKLSDRIDALRENVRSDRHKLANDVEAVADEIRKEQAEQRDRLTRLEIERK